jgi:hypothetical protein
VQGRSITRGFRAIVCAAGLVTTAMATAPGAQNSSDLLRPATPPQVSSAHWREAPQYVALFAPPVYRDAYRAFVSEADLASVLRSVTADVTAGTGTAIASPGAWRGGQENPLDAFGSGGIYDRWRVARLYGSRRPTVARGPRGLNGIVDESWTLISPYPMADLARLDAGTLILVLRVP